MIQLTLEDMQCTLNLHFHKHTQMRREMWPANMLWNENAENVLLEISYTK